MDFRLRFRSSLFTGILTAGLVSLAACSGGGGDHTTQTELRVFHASPDAPNVDVEVDGEAALEGVPYEAASPFLSVPSGARRITVKAAGTDTAVIDAEVELGGERRYLVIAAGKVANIAPIVSEVSKTKPAPGSARVRVLHSAASAPVVDVYVTAPNTDLESSFTLPVLAGVPFGVISDYLEVPAGSYDLLVTPTGTQDVAIEARGVAIADGFIGTVAALDKKGGGAPFSLKVLDER